MPAQSPRPADAATPDNGRSEPTAAHGQPPEDEARRRPSGGRAAEEAATVIQRNYRGYRGRRQLQGLGLDASTRWYEAIKEARYRSLTTPTSRKQRAAGGHLDTPTENARNNWRRLSAIAARAREDDTSDTDGEPGMSPQELSDYRRRKSAAKKERQAYAKTMDLAYFLEMVDTKHRYGSHLRAYHAEWKKADTNENFFYWLDHGEGRHVEVPNVPRDKLDADQVRYLSREERLNYLVKIDEQGRLRWAKNGLRISTNGEWRDSVNGIVPKDDTTSPTWKHGEERDPETDSHTSGAASTSSLSASSAAEQAHHYTNDDLKKAQGLKKLQKVSAAVILNHLLQKTVKPGTWIFVADTSFRLYVGIKQSGAFQHSSFLHGARISAAGLIKIKGGQLRRLSPLSGHYRPPTRNFRAFVHSLKDAGVDMSRVSISRSYAVLLGLEAYQKTSKKIRAGERRVEEGAEWVMHPEEARRKEEERKDKSKSAQKEREHLDRQRAFEDEESRRWSFGERLMRKLWLGPKEKVKGKVKERAEGKSDPLLLQSDGDGPP